MNKTEFRTKKNGKKYPLNPRKPYGVERKIAFEDVQKLRKEGNRARLIKTNARLDLYSPFESALNVPEVVGSPEQPVPEKVPQSTNISKSITPLAVREDLGIDNSRGNINLNKADLDAFFGKNGYYIKVSNGNLFFAAIDSSHVALIQETMETSLPDGTYVPESYGKDFSIKSYDPDSDPYPLEKAPWSTERESPRDWKLMLEGDDIKRFTSLLDKDTVVFRISSEKNGGTTIRVHEKQGYYSEKATNLKEEKFTTAQSIGGVDNGKVTVDSKYMKSVLRTMLGRSDYRNPKSNVVTIKLQSDYPVEIETRRLGSDNKHITVKGIIAPRME